MQYFFRTIPQNQSSEPLVKNFDDSDKCNDTVETASTNDHDMVYFSYIFVFSKKSYDF